MIVRSFLRSKRSSSRPRPKCQVGKADRNKHLQYYEVKLGRKAAHLTHEGIAEAQRVAGIGSLYVDQNIDLPHLLEQSFMLMRCTSLIAIM